MRVGVDATCWSNQRGYGRYARELVRALTELDADVEYRLFVDAGTAHAAADLQESPNTRIVVVETAEAPTEAASAAGRRSLRDLWAMGNAVRRGPELDLFYFPSVYTFFPLLSRKKMVLTIHDAIPEHYPEFVFPNWQSRLFWNMKVRWAIWQSTVIATVSESAKKDIVQALHLDGQRVRVIPDAVSASFRPLCDRSQVSASLQRYGLANDERIILYVGGLSPHKNLETLIDAYGGLRRGGMCGDVRLVLAGDFDRDVFYSSYPGVQQRINDLHLAGQVLLTGFVPDTDLVCLYNAAEVLVLPSFDEGFGLPALEAMACGTPVVASRAGALPEVVGEAGLFFDPRNPEQLRERLEEVLGDPDLRQRLARAALCRARDFSWERSAQRALATFEEVAGIRTPGDRGTQERW